MLSTYLAPMKAPDDIARDIPTTLKAGLLDSPIDRLPPELALALTDADTDDDMASARVGHVRKANEGVCAARNVSKMLLRCGGDAGADDVVA